MYKHKGFTLMEVLVATAVTGLVITAGFRLIAMSYRLMNEVETERALIAAAEDIWLRFRLEDDMPDSGTDDKTGISWIARERSLTVDEYELTYREVTVSIPNGRSTVIYVAE